MGLSTLLINSAWAGLFAIAAALLFTAPARFIMPTFFCGFAGRLVRDALIGAGAGPSWSTLVAAAILVLVATVFVRKHAAPPVVLLGGVLPLAGSISIVNATLDLMKLSSLEGEALAATAVSLSANIGKAFTTFLALALGLAAGLAAVRVIRGENFWEGA
jgi:uncharacterized membrane protein YjjB (DUF3815 family)